MASVLSLGGYVVSASGSALASKAVTLKNNSSGATVTTTTTDSNGYWEFLNQDESVAYRVEVAVGGASTQVHTRRPAGAEFTYAYVRSALRTAAAATVAFGGAVGVGPLAAAALLHLTSEAAGTLPLIQQLASTDALGSRIRIRKSRGTAASPTIVQSGDEIGGLAMTAHDGAGTFHTAAAVLGLVDGTPGANDMPGRLSFLTTPDGSTTATERVRIDSGGTVYVANATTVPGSNPVGGGVLYAEGGALKYRGSGGTVTTLGGA